jgi:ADP-heptose:LPS heptosyltransferase
VVIKNKKLRYLLQDLELFFKKIIIRIFLKPCAKKSLTELKISGVKKLLLIRQHDPLGDIILSTAVFKNINTALPGAAIDVLTRPDIKQVFDGNSYIRKIFIFDKNNYYNLFSFFKIRKALKKEKYDLVLVLGTTSISFFSLWLAKATRAEFRAGISGSFYGKKDYTEAFLSVELPYSGGVRHQTEKNLDILRGVGLPSKNTSLYMETTAEEDSRASALFVRFGLKKGDKIVGFHCGAGKLENRWPACNFAAVSDHLVKQNGMKAVLFSGINEKELNNTFLKSAQEKVTVFPALSLREFVAAVKKVNLLICNDTGVLHIAAAVNTKTLAIFGPTDPAQWNPLGEGHFYVKSENDNIFKVKTEEVIEIAGKALKVF